MAFLESKCEYSDGERIPIRPATSRSVTADSPSRRAISHAASMISRRVASRRSARLSRLGKALMVRQYGDAEEACQDSRRRLRPAGAFTGSSGELPQSASAGWPARRVLGPARLIMPSEHSGNELAAAADTELAECHGQVLLNGVGRYMQFPDDLAGGVSPDDQGDNTGLRGGQ